MSTASRQGDYIPEEQVLAFLEANPDGVTVRRIAKEFETSYTAALNAARGLLMNDKAEYTRPTKQYENKRWKAIPEESQ